MPILEFTCEYFYDILNVTLSAQISPAVVFSKTLRLKTENAKDTLFIVTYIHVLSPRSP